MEQSSKGNQLRKWQGGRHAISRPTASLLGQLGVKPRRIGHRVRGHTAAVTGLALNRDESLIYASTRSGTVQVFSRETGACVKEFCGHDWWLSDVAVAGNVIASAGADGKIMLWDVNGHCVDVLTGHRDVVTSVSFSRDGTLLASSSRDHTVMIWRISQSGQGEHLGTFTGHKNWVLSVCFTDDNHVVSGGFDGALLWHAIERKPLAALNELPSVTRNLSMQTPFGFIRDHRTSVLKVHCRGNYAIAGSSDGHARVWDLSTGGLVRRLTGVGGSAFSVHLARDCRTVATGWESDAICVCSIPDTEHGFWVGGHSDWPLDLAFTRDGKLISAGMDSKIKEWDIKTRRQVASYGGLTESVCDIALRERSLVVGGHDNAVSVYDLSSGNRRSAYSNLTHWVNCVALSPDERYVSAGTRDGDDVLISAQSGRLHAHLACRGSEATHMAFSGDGTHLLVATRGGKVLLFATATGACVREYAISSALVHHIQFLRDGKEYLAGCWDGKTYRVSIASGRLLATYGPSGSGDENAVEVVGVTDDARRLVTVAFDGYVRVFDFESTELVSMFRAHAGRIRSMAMRNNILATGGLDATIKVWDWRVKRLLHTIRDCGDSITALHFTAGGDRLVAGSRDGTVRFFSCAKKYELLAVLYSLDGGGCLWESPDGWFYSDRADETIEVFECDEDGRNRMPLSQDDPRRRSYVSTHNDFSRITGRILGDDVHGPAERFDKLVALHQAAGRTRRLLKEHGNDGFPKPRNTLEAPKNERNHS